LAQHQTATVEANLVSKPLIKYTSTSEERTLQKGIRQWLRFNLDGSEYLLFRATRNREVERWDVRALPILSGNQGLCPTN